MQNFGSVRTSMFISRPGVDCEATAVETQGLHSLAEGTVGYTVLGA